MKKKNRINSFVLWMTSIVAAVLILTPGLFAQEDIYVSSDAWESDMRDKYNQLREGIGKFNLSYSYTEDSGATGSFSLSKNTDTEVDDDSDYGYDDDDDDSSTVSLPSQYQLEKQEFQRNYNETKTIMTRIQCDQFRTFHATIAAKHHQIIDEYNDDNTALNKEGKRRYEDIAKEEKRETGAVRNNALCGIHESDNYRKKQRLIALGTHRLTRRISKSPQREMELLNAKAQKHMDFLQKSIPQLQRKLHAFHYKHQANLDQIVTWSEEMHKLAVEIRTESFAFLLDLGFDMALSSDSKLGKKAINLFKDVRENLVKCPSLSKGNKRKMLALVDNIISLFENTDNIKTVYDMKKNFLDEDSDYKKAVEGSSMLFQQLLDIAEKKGLGKKLKKPLQRYIAVPKYFGTVATDLTIMSIIMVKMKNLEMTKKEHEEVIEKFKSEINRNKRSIAAIQDCMDNNPDADSLRRCLRDIDLDFNNRYRKKRY